MVTFCAEFNSNFENWWLFWVYFLKSISSTKTGNLKVFQFDSRNNYGFLYRISILNFPNYQQKKILLKVERLKDFSPLFCTVILIWQSLLKLRRRKNLLICVGNTPLFTQIARRRWLGLSLDEFKFCMSNQNFSLVFKFSLFCDSICQFFYGTSNKTLFKHFEQLSENKAPF